MLLINRVDERNVIAAILPHNEWAEIYETLSYYMKLVLTDCGYFKLFSIWYKLIYSSFLRRTRIVILILLYYILFYIKSLNGASDGSKITLLAIVFLIQKYFGKAFKGMLNYSNSQKNIGYFRYFSFAMVHALNFCSGLLGILEKVNKYLCRRRTRIIVQSFSVKKIPKVDTNESRQ